MRMGGLRILLLLLLAGVARAAPGKPADSHPAPDGSNPAPPPAAADPASREAREREEARRLLREGNAMLDQGRYLEALDLFMRAHALVPSAKLAFNIAQTLNELGRFVEALDQYEAFLRDEAAAAVPDLQAVASARVFDLSARVARVELQVDQ